MGECGCSLIYIQNHFLGRAIDATLFANMEDQGEKYHHLKNRDNLMLHAVPLDFLQN